MEKIYLPEIHIAGVEVRTSNINQKSSKDLYELWEKFLTEGILHFLPNRINDDIYCVYTDYESDHLGNYTALVGYQVPSFNEIPESLSCIKIKSDVYHRLAVQGDLRKGLVEQTWYQIWASDLPRSYHADFEVYGENSREVENAVVEIFISIK